VVRPSSSPWTASIASVREAGWQELGLELIVTDHHEPREILPDAAVRIHPQLPDHSYPFDKLCGSGVAFKLAWALCQKACGSEKVTERYRNYLLDSVCLAALGTVADVVPLHDENRILVRHGLNRLRTAPSAGLRALMTAAGLGEGADVRAADIGYRLGPRLNAAGRLGCARIIVDLLTTTVPARRRNWLTFWKAAERQTLGGVWSAMREMIEKQGWSVRRRRCWRASTGGGVIGIAAGRLRSSTPGRRW
jgi:single-stranded-DNA-specific exonuclease